MDNGKKAYEKDFIEIEGRWIRKSLVSKVEPKEDGVELYWGDWEEFIETDEPQRMAKEILNELCN